MLMVVLVHYVPGPLTVLRERLLAQEQVLDPYARNVVLAITKMVALVPNVAVVLPQQYSSPLVRV